jgi:hypothetical protein
MSRPAWQKVASPLLPVVAKSTMEWTWLRVFRPLLAPVQLQA